MPCKYTVYGNKELDIKIDSDMELIVKTALGVVPEKDISAIILGGGYGRGQGGVSFVGGKMGLYNDYDMFMVTKNVSRDKKRKYFNLLFNECEKLKDIVGVDVDFGPLKNLNELENLPFTLMYYELKKGHEVIYGQKNILDLLPEHDINNIPSEEALNYMLNRGVGLLLAYDKFALKEKSRSDNEFIERNIFKALMACGDIFLILEKKYSYSYTDRCKLISTFKDRDIIKNENFIEYYIKSINYKLKPENRFELIQDDLNKTIVFFKQFYLYAFSKYWNTEINSFEEYYSMLEKSGIATCKEYKLKNILLNMKEVGHKNFDINFYLNYPRYRLFFILPYFLFKYRINSNTLYKALGTTSNISVKDKHFRFLRLWNRFN
ncbi:MAG: hypothetical protein GY756_05735 [bacterium]|nr:hypothetical protein [bacterium]